VIEMKIPALTATMHLCQTTADVNTHFDLVNRSQFLPKRKSHKTIQITKARFFQDQNWPNDIIAWNIPANAKKIDDIWMCSEARVTQYFDLVPNQAENVTM